MRTPRQSRSESSAERMLDAAAALLADGGLAAVTVAAVAQHAGTSNGSLYHRFGDRAGLLAALQQRSLDAVVAETAAAFAQADAVADDDAAARHLAASALAIFERHRAAMRAFLVDLADEPGVAAVNARTTAGIRAVVEPWLGRRYGASPAAAAEAFALLHALGLSTALLGPDPAGVAPLGADAVARAVLAVSRRR